jgi:hypothetical protein
MCCDGVKATLRCALKLLTEELTQTSAAVHVVVELLSSQ